MAQRHHHLMDYPAAVEMERWKVIESQFGNMNDGWVMDFKGRSIGQINREGNKKLSRKLVIQYVRIHGPILWKIALRGTFAALSF